MDLKITLFQADLAWEDKPANLRNLEAMLSSLEEDTHLVILPEMFTTGFSMNAASLAEPMNGPSLRDLRNIAQSNHLALTGSFICKEGGNHYNRLFFIYPDGEIKTYDKRHLFTMGGEQEAYNRGHERLLIEYKGWKIMPLVCYDLRFPVWCRNTENFHLQLFVANWPAPRADVWQTLLKARALENQCYVAGVNRIGQDGRGLSYSGDSMVYDPRGQILWQGIPEKEQLHTITLSMENLLYFRKKFPVLEDGDDFQIL